MLGERKEKEGRALVGQDADGTRGARGAGCAEGAARGVCARCEGAGEYSLGYTRFREGEADISCFLLGEEVDTEGHLRTHVRVW